MANLMITRKFDWYSLSQAESEHLSFNLEKTFASLGSLDFVVLSARQNGSIPEPRNPPALLLAFTL